MQFLKLEFTNLENQMRSLWRAVGHAAEGLMQLKVCLSGMLRGNSTSMVQAVHWQCSNASSATFCMGSLTWNKESFLTFILIPSKKNNWSKKDLFQVPKQTYARTPDTALCWHSKKAALLAPIWTLTWKDWGSPPRGSLQLILDALSTQAIL